MKYFLQRHLNMYQFAGQRVASGDVFSYSRSPLVFITILEAYRIRCLRTVTVRAPFLLYRFMRIFERVGAAGKKITRNCPTSHYGNHLIAGMLLLLSITPAHNTAYARGKPAPEPWRVDKVTFTGNYSYGSYQLINIIDLKPLPFRKKPRFSATRLQSDSARIANYYSSKGFLSIVINPHLMYHDSSGKKMTVHFQIQENKRTVIAHCYYSGVRPDSGTFKKLKCKNGSSLDQTNVVHDEQVLKETLRGKGYLNPTVITRQGIDTLMHEARLDFFTRTGPLIIVDSIMLQGVSDLTPAIVLRECAFSSGDTLTEERVRETERNLYRTELITGVNIGPYIDDSSTVHGKDAFSGGNIQQYPILVTVREANFLKLKLGAGYGSDEGPRGSLETSYSNFLRLGHRLALKGNVSPLRQQAQTIYSTPWFLGIPLRFDGTLYYNSFTNKETYRGVFRGVRLMLEKEMDETVIIHFLTGFEDVLWIRSDGLPEGYPLWNTQSFGVEIICDTRDDLLDPSNGLYNAWKTQLAGSIDKKSNQFIKITNDTRFYCTSGRFRFASGLKVGWVCPYGRSTLVPLQERFYAGGSKSVRGFKDNHLLTTSDSTRSAKSGTVMLTANLLEMRFPLYRILHGAFFVDAGILRDGIPGATFKTITHELRWTAGPGLRLNTPLAILRLDLGFKLDRRPEEEVMQLHIDVGQSF